MSTVILISKWELFAHFGCHTCTSISWYCMKRTVVSRSLLEQISNEFDMGYCTPVVPRQSWASIFDTRTETTGHNSWIIWLHWLRIIQTHDDPYEIMTIRIWRQEVVKRISMREDVSRWETLQWTHRFDLHRVISRILWHLTNKIKSDNTT